MPIYTYYCQREDFEFDARAAICDADEPSRCPNCGEEAERVFRPSDATLSVLYRGSGWARKDRS